jgi:hypothetical protein
MLRGEILAAGIGFPVGVMLLGAAISHPVWGLVYVAGLLGLIALYFLSRRPTLAQQALAGAFGLLGPAVIVVLVISALARSMANDHRPAA